MKKREVARQHELAASQDLTRLMGTVEMLSKQIENLQTLLRAIDADNVLLKAELRSFGRIVSELSQMPTREELRVSFKELNVYHTQLATALSQLIVRSRKAVGTFYN